MAKIGKVAAVFTASTSGLSAGVNTAVSQFGKLGGNAKGLGANLKTLQAIGAQGPGEVGPAADKAQKAFKRFTGMADRLRDQLQAGRMTSDQFAEKMLKVDQAADKAAKQLSFGARTADKFRSSEDRLQKETAQLTDAFEAGAIDADTFEAASEDLAKQFDQTGKEADSMGGEMGGAASDADKLGGKLNILIGIEVAKVLASIGRAAFDAAKSFASFGGEIAQGIDESKKLADSFGFTFAQMQGLQLAADMSGVTVEQLSVAMTKADEAFVNASKGAKGAQDKLAKLGLTADDLQGMSVDERFDAIVDSISALPTEAERAAAAVAMFGEQGAKMLPLFNAGSGAIREAREEAERLGLTLSDEQATNVEKMNDSFTKVKSAVEGVIGQVVASLAPSLEAVAGLFTDMVGDVGGANIGQTIADALMDGAIFVADIFDSVGAFLFDIFGTGEAVGNTFAYVADAFGQVFELFDIGINLGLSFVSGLDVVFSSFVQSMLEIIASIADWIPGLGKVADGLRQSASEWQQRAVASTESSRSQMEIAREKFLFGGKPDREDEKPGFLGGTLRDARQRAMEAREGGDKEQTKAELLKGLNVTVEASASLTDTALKGTDSKSAEGIAEYFRLLRRTGKTAEEKQLEVQQKMAESLHVIASKDDAQTTELLFGV